VEGNKEAIYKAAQVMGFANIMHKAKCIEITKKKY